MRRATEGAGEQRGGGTGGVVADDANTGVGIGPPWGGCTIGVGAALGGAG